MNSLVPRILLVVGLVAEMSCDITSIGVAVETP